MRVAEEEKLHVFGFQLLLKISHIHVIAVVVAEHQRAADDSSSVICNDLGKWIVNRRLNQHSIAWLSVGLDCHRECKHNTRRFDQPLLFRLPVVMAFHPSRNGPKIRSLRIAVSVNAHFRTLHQRIFDVGGCLKIHIRHPQRQHVGWHTAFYCEVIF